MVRIAKPELDETTLIQEFEYVANKLDWTKEEFQKIFEGENKTYLDYPNNWPLISLANKAMQVLGLERRLLR
jgi:hypothetical protein